MASSMAGLARVREGKAIFLAPVEKVVSREMPVFYNPVMEYNRSISIAVLKAEDKKGMQIADPLAGTGVRAVRFFKELKKGAIRRAYINDHDTGSVQLIKKNLSLNGIRTGFELSCKDANLFLLTGMGFDYIDIDPFGSPNRFLNSAVERIARGGILAVTATDTGALCGSFPEACIRKYWATPLHSYEMHEVGLRILIRKVQLIGMQADKALSPILSFDREHYMRIFFRCEKGKKLCDAIASKHGFYKGAGPIWTGRLHDSNLLAKLELDDAFTKLLKQELDILGFYEIPKILKHEKLGCEKKLDMIVNEARKSGYKVSRTHFSMQGIKTDMPYPKLVKLLKE